MKKCLMAALVAFSCSLLAEYKPEAWNLKAREDFAAQRFGVFIHWGLYANYAQGEWYLQHGKLDEAAYSRMMHGFCPSRFDAREWVRIVKDAGAKYMTVTSRHHDGFSLWPSKVDDGYNIANTPFRRDILGELAAACRAEGLQLNFYYSLSRIEKEVEKHEVVCIGLGGRPGSQLSADIRGPDRRGLCGCRKTVVVGRRKSDAAI